MLKRNSKLILVVLMVALLGLNGLAFAAKATKAPKYVFYFVGDGLGASQRQAAEYFMQVKNDDKDLKLVMNQFPVAGMNTTHSADTLVTDSAAAGTALASGHKTGNGMIAMLPNGEPVKTLVEAANEKGMGTGVVSTMRLTHATPASFVAHNPSRYNANDIALDLVKSDVDYFAGGGYRHFLPKGSKHGSKRKDDKNLVKEFYNKGYKTFVTEAATPKFRTYKPAAEDKVFAAFTYSHLPYDIDRSEKLPSLAEMTEKGIQHLSQKENGFFMMVEGGRIDYAAHANDPAGVIHDVLALDKAIERAYDFYKKHPEETLIVVVGDHETGGFGLGFGNDYFLKMEQLLDVKASMDMVGYDGDREALYQTLADKFGLNDLTDEEKAQIEKAMDMDDNGKNVPNGPSWMSPVNATVAHIISERVNVQWTTWAHTGTSIPLSAVGASAESFGGYKDNTELAKTMANILGLELD